jgi:hypothetical protein
MLHRITKRVNLIHIFNKACLFFTGKNCCRYTQVSLLDSTLKIVRFKHHRIHRLFNFFNLHSGGWSPSWVHSARRPLTGLLYLPRVIVRMENFVEWMAGETEVLGENLPRRHFVHHKSHLSRPGIEPGPQRWEASDWPLKLRRGLIGYLCKERSLATIALHIVIWGIRMRSHMNSGIYAG